MVFSKEIIHFFGQKSKYFLFFFLKKSSQKILFFDILDKRELFLDQQYKVLKSSKQRDFPKGIIHGFCPNIKLFLLFFLGEKKFVKTIFLILWIEKNGFLDQKIELLKSAKHRHFPKGIVHGFCPNIKFFLIYIFWEKTSQERLFDILDRKE